jgi:hypothetical protein
MRATLLRLTGVIAFLCATGIAQGTPVIYYVNVPILEPAGGTFGCFLPGPPFCAFGVITGTITTDGKIGLLDPSTDILAWNLSVFVPPGQGPFIEPPPEEGFIFGPASYPDGSGNPAQCISGFGTGPYGLGATSIGCLEATPTELLVPGLPDPSGPLIFVEICPLPSPEVCAGGGFVGRDPLQFTYTLSVGYGELDFGPGQVVGTAPEPDNAALLGCGLGVLYFARRRFRAHISGPT